MLVLQYPAQLASTYRRRNSLWIEMGLWICATTLKDQPDAENSKCNITITLFCCCLRAWDPIHILEGHFWWMWLLLCWGSNIKSCRQKKKAEKTRIFTGEIKYKICQRLRNSIYFLAHLHKEKRGEKLGKGAGFWIVEQSWTSLRCGSCWSESSSLRVSNTSHFVQAGFFFFVDSIYLSYFSWALTLHCYCLVGKKSVWLT